MITEIKAYQASCDNCGETFCDEHGDGFTVFSDEGDMQENMDSDGWHVNGTDEDHEDKVYCPLCYKEHPEIDDKIIVDLTRKIPPKNPPTSK